MKQLFCFSKFFCIPRTAKIFRYIFFIILSNVDIHIIYTRELNKNYIHFDTPLEAHTYTHIYSRIEFVKSFLLLLIGYTEKWSKKKNFQRTPYSDNQSAVLTNSPCKLDIGPRDRGIVARGNALRVSIYTCIRCLQPASFITNRALPFIMSYFRKCIRIETFVAKQASLAHGIIWRLLWKR